MATGPAFPFDYGMAIDYGIIGRYLSMDTGHSDISWVILTSLRRPISIAGF